MKKLLITFVLCCFIGSSFADSINNVSNQIQPLANKHTKATKHSKTKQKTPHKKIKHHKKITKRTVKTPTVDTSLEPFVSPKVAASSEIPKDYIDETSVRRQPRLYSYAAIALNANTGKIIVSKNPNAQLPIASITKLMTAIVVLDSGVDLNDYVTITNADIDTLRNTYSRLKVGMQFKRKDLLLLALMSSENRAAHALGRTTFNGGINAFTKKMNLKAKSLKMNSTQYYDPTGLTNMNTSTALDLSKLIQAAYSYDEIRHDTTTKNADVMFGPRYTHRYINSDALVRANKLQIQLSKTGFINEAGHCLALYSIVDNKPIVMVFLNSAGKSGRLIDAMTIKNYIGKDNS